MSENKYNEPWELDKDSALQIIRDNNNKHITDIDGYGRSGEWDKFHAQRIIKCVNLLAGVSDRYLDELTMAPFWLLFKAWLTDVKEQTPLCMLIDELQSIREGGHPADYIPRSLIESKIRTLVTMWKIGGNQKQEFNRLLPDCCKECDGTGNRFSKAYSQEPAEPYRCLQCKGKGHTNE